MPVSPVSYYNLVERVCEAYEYNTRLHFIDSLVDKGVGTLICVLVAAVLVYAIKSMSEASKLY